MIGPHNLVNDLLSAEQLELYTSYEYPFNLDILYPPLKSKLEENPEYEIWVPLVYYRYSKFVRKPSFIFKPHKIFISNQGRICSLRRKEPALLSPYFADDVYPRIALQDITGENSIVIHRAVACSFLALGEEVRPCHPKDLQVNHLNGNKEDYSLGNLEWSTEKSNMSHAFRTGLAKPLIGVDNPATKPIKGKVLIGKFQGLEFILYGKKDFDLYGFQQPNVSACCAGRLKTHKGCAFSFASAEENDSLQKGISEEVHRDLLEHNPLKDKKTMNRQ